MLYTVLLRCNLTSKCKRLTSNLASARESLVCILCHTHECKGVNCTACGSEIMCASQFASASSITTMSKIACVSKSIVQLILIIRTFSSLHIVSKLAEEVRSAVLGKTTRRRWCEVQVNDRESVHQKLT